MTTVLQKIRAWRSRLVWIRVKHGPAAGLWLEMPAWADQKYFETEMKTQIELTRCLRPGMVFYDLGANLGFFSLIAARLVWENGKVFSFEPEIEMTARLRRNVARNELEHNIRVIEAAAWKESGTVGFSTDLETRDKGCGKIKIGDNREVKCVSLDDFVTTMPAPDVIKCDVEGAEVEVFLGARRLLESRHPIIVCELHSETNSWLLREYLSDLNYQCEKFDANHMIARASRSLV